MFTFVFLNTSDHLNYKGEGDFSYTLTNVQVRFKPETTDLQIKPFFTELDPVG